MILRYSPGFLALAALLVPSGLIAQYPDGPILCKVDCIDSLAAAGIGYNGSVLRTTDGGWTWVLVDSGRGIGNPELYDIDFPSRDTGWALTGSPEPSRILRTTDGGTAWDVQYSQACSRLRSLFMLDTRLGWAVGEGGSTLRTTDGGTTWRTRPSGSADEFCDVWFVDSLHGWAVGRALIRTTTGGETWETVPGIGARTVCFADPLNGWIGSDGVSRTTDGGRTWSRVGELGNGLVVSTDLVFHDQLRGESTVWDMNPDPPSGHLAGLMKTTDGGLTWISVIDDCTLWGLSYSPSGHGIAVGARGVYWSSDGGMDWDLRGYTGVATPPVNLPSVTCLEPNFPNPFNPTTTITYSLSGVTSRRVHLTVHDLLGRQVATLVDGEEPPGQRAIRWDAGTIPAGVYFCTLRTPENVKSVKMLLVR